jgi:hypothetical protein
MGDACPSYPGTHLHFAVYQKQADGAITAYKPEPISGYTNLLAGNWYISDNVVYTPVYAAAGSQQSGNSVGSPSSQSNQPASVAINSSPKESLFSAIINGVQNFTGNVVNKITSTVGKAFSSLKSSVADVFNSNSDDGNGVALDNQSNPGDQPIDNSLASASGGNKIKSPGKILNSDSGAAAQAGGDLAQTISQPSSPAASDDDSHSQPDVKPAETENQNLKNIQSSSTSPSVASSTDKNPLSKNNASPENSSAVNLSCPFNSGVGQIPSRQVLINEVAWMGSANSANDEWIEIKNVSNQEIDLKNWQLAGKDDDIKINFSSLKNTKISPQSFILLERTDDSSVPNISADLIYTGSLANSNEGLRLFDGVCRLADEVLVNSDWPAGNNSTKQTMERDLIGFGWHSSAFPGGTPKRENSQVVYSGGGGGSQSSSPQTDNQTNQQSAASKPEIVINEIMYNLEGADEGREWVEIFNNGSTTADLTNWKFYDGQSNHKLNLARGSAIIYPGGYAIISSGADKFLTDNPSFSGTILEGSFSLNNSNEILSIKDVSDNIIDQVSYSSSLGANGDGLSLQKINGVFQPASPTPGEENKISLSQTSQTEKALSAFFTISPTNPKANQEVVFLASSSDPEIINNYQWDFNDSSTSLKQNISTSSPIIVHIFDNPGNYEIGLSVFSSDSSSSYSAIISVSSSTATSSDNFASSSAKSAVAGKVFISEIKAGDGSNADDEFVEIYNPTDQTVDSTNWSLQKKTSSSSAEVKNLVFSFSTSSVAAKSFFLIASNDYSGQIIPDIRYSNNSNNLAYLDDVLILKDAQGKIVDEVRYDEIPAGKSLERKAATSSTPASMSVGDDRFLGNAYESGDDSFDFVVQENPNPQNSFSLPEPRNKPTPPTPLTATSDIAVYDSNAKAVIFSWQNSQDALGATSTIYYEISKIISSTSSETNSTSSVIIKTTSTAVSYPVGEGRFNFGVQAFDGEGLGSEIVYGDLVIEAMDNSTSSEQATSTQSSNALPTSTVIFSQMDNSTPLTTITSFTSGGRTYTYPYNNKSGQTFLAVNNENLDKIKVDLWAYQAYLISCGEYYAFPVYLNLYDVGLADNLGSLSLVASSSAGVAVERCSNLPHQTVSFEFSGEVSLVANHFYYFELNAPNSNSYWEVGFNGTTTDVVPGSYYYNGGKYSNYDSYGFAEGTLISVAPAPTSTETTNTTSTLTIPNSDSSALQNADSTIAVATSTLSSTSTNDLSATSTLLLADLYSDLGTASSTDSGETSASTSTINLDNSSTSLGASSSATENLANSTSTGDNTTSSEEISASASTTVN